jgi:DivIVA domain-containing protein
MELTPDLLLEAKFSSARRGYDMAEVDDFLERCAEGLDVLLTRLRAEFDRAERAEADLVELRRRVDSGEAPTSDAPFAPPVEPEPVFEAAPEPTPGPVEAPVHAASPTVGEPMRILIAAERTAEAAVADARAEAERIRAEAESIAGAQRSEAETLLTRARNEAEAEARRAGDEVKRAIQSEVVTLRRDRDALSDDIRILRRWLDDQRTRLRTTARDLQRLADDPSALRDIPVPDTAMAEGAEADDDSAPEALGEGPDMGDAGRAPFAGDDDGDDDGGADDGEPTQAVPFADLSQPFDDADVDDAPADSVR